MARLHTFGEVHVAGDDGQPLSGAATQRRTLALLSLLAASGDAGLSRDKIIGFLWPESDPERARHSLTQALYTARRALDDDDLFVVSAAAVRLDATRLASDVREFESALASGDLELAVSIYAGPFLDGFFIAGASEFEQWSSARRAVYQQGLVQALEQLAARSESQRDSRAALAWRRRLAAIVPLDAGNTAKLIAAMASVGDRAGGIQQARIHASLLREELDLDPDPEIEALAARLRTGVDTPDVEPSHDGPPNEVAADEPPQVVEVHQTEVPHPLAVSRHDPLAVQRRPRFPRGTRWAVLAVLVSSLIGIGVLIGRSGAPDGQEVTQLAVRQRLVVAPFRVAGADRSLAYLRDGIVELLSTRLSDDSLARTVDAGAVLGAWRAAGLAPTMDVPRDSVVKLATRLGAERVVVGSVVGTPARMVVSASVLTLPSGTVSGEATVAGPADSIATLLDRLAARLVVSEAGQEDELSHSVSRYLPALRSYLAGQSAFRRGDYAGALRSYGIALRRDSTFALAALYQASSADRLGVETPLRVGVASAWASRAVLSERDRSRLLVLSGPRFPAPSTAAELSAAWQHMVDLAPNSADAWYELAVRLLHDGPSAGARDAQSHAASALRRALFQDSTHVAARELLASLSADSAADSSRAPTTPSATKSGALAPVTLVAQWQRALASGDSAALERLRAELPGRDTWELRAFAHASQLGAPSLDDGARALAIIEKRSSTLAERVDATLAAHSLALERGSTSEALEATTRLRRLLPASRAWLRLRVLDGLYGDGDASAATAAADSLAGAMGSAPFQTSGTSEGWLADACVLSQWRLLHGDTARVAGTIARLRRWRDAGSALVVSTAPRACAELLDALHAAVDGRREARQRAARLDSLVFTPQVAGDASVYAALTVARIHEMLGDSRRALDALRKARPAASWPRYAAAALRQEGRLAETLGDTARARVVYERYVAFRPHRDDVPDTLGDRVRDRLRRLVRPARAE